MHTASFAAVLALFAQAGFAQNPQVINTSPTLKASNIAGSSTSNLYPPSGSKL
jgi:hypothetical protein